MSVLVQQKEKKKKRYKKGLVKQEEQYSNSEVGFVSFHIVFA
jgi:hypothetical protein